jgi:hypothetical protein
VLSRRRWRRRRDVLNLDPIELGGDERPNASGGADNAGLGLVIEPGGQVDELSCERRGDGGLTVQPATDVLGNIPDGQPGRTQRVAGAVELLA